MTKDKDSDDEKLQPNVFDSVGQLTFAFVSDDGFSFEIVGTTLEGYSLFRRMEGHGGYSYWTDEIAPGVCVFDEGTSNPMSMFEALHHLGIGKLLWDHIGHSFGYHDK